VSGKDEKPDGNIPICSKCKERPEFWILQPDVAELGYDCWFWLHSDRAIQIDPDCNRLDFVAPHGGNIISLEKITLITCRLNVDKSHTFTFGNKTFQEVLQYAKRFENERTR
jgi:phosphomannomutase